MDSDFYLGHIEVNNKPIQFVLVTDRYVVIFMIYVCYQKKCYEKRSTTYQHNATLSTKYCLEWCQIFHQLSPLLLPH